MIETVVKGIMSATETINVYRGCTHGCIYCDSRSKCYHIDHEFTDIEVKVNAAEILEQTLQRKRKKCVVNSGSMCDPYMPIEKEICLTRRCLEVIERYDFGAAMLTKSDLVMRDIDLFDSINQRTRAVLNMTLTTFDENLCKILEPNVASTIRRAEVLRNFSDRGIPTVVWLCPILPFINDTEENLLGILELCRAAGVKAIVNFGMGMTLREGDREYYYDALDKHFEGVKNKYVKTYGFAYSIPSPNSTALMRLYQDYCKRYGIIYKQKEAFDYIKQYRSPQLSLFD